MEKLLQGLFAFGGATISFMFGGWSAMLTVLITFMIIDYVTGVIASGYEGKLSSSIGFKGIIKKVYIFVYVTVGHLADTMIGDGTLIMDTVIFWYLANEGLSIIENGGRLGVPVPPVLKQAIDVLKQKGEGNNDK